MYVGEDDEERDSDAIEATTRGPDSKAGDVRARTSKLSEGVKLRIGRKAPTEEDLPRRLSNTLVIMTFSRQPLRSWKYHQKWQSTEMNQSWKKKSGVKIPGWIVANARVPAV